MAVTIFPLLHPIHAVEKSGVIAHKYKIKPKEIPGKIRPGQGVFALLRNICKIKVPINTKNKATRPAIIKTERKNAIYFIPFPRAGGHRFV